MARFFDLMPFVAIGLAVDYFTGGLSGPDIVQDFVTSFGGDPAVGYGVPFPWLFFLAIFQFQNTLANAWLQDSTRFTNGCHEVAHRHGGLYYDIGKRGRLWLSYQVM